MRARDHDASPLQYALAGAISGAVSAAVMSPLDVARTRLQVQALIVPQRDLARGPVDMLRKIWRTEGARGFYVGVGATMLGVGAQWACFFPLYQRLSAGAAAALAARAPPWLSRPARDALAQSLAAAATAVLSDALTAPLWVVRTRLQLQGLHEHAGSQRSHYRGVWHAGVTIAREEGPAALYKGLTASWLGISHVMVYFPVYEALKRARGARGDGGTGGATRSDGSGSSGSGGDGSGGGGWRGGVSGNDRRGDTRSGGSGGSGDSRGSSSGTDTIGTLLAATCAKLAASSTTYPHEVVRARLQDQQLLRHWAAPASEAGVAAAAAGVAAAAAAAKVAPAVATADALPLVPQYAGIYDCAVRIWRAEGLRGLYAGFSVNLLRTLPATAITFVCFEQTLLALRRA